MGIAGAAVSAFLLGLTPIIMMRLIDSGGWRGCYRWLGVSEFVGAGLVALLWREAPELYGVLPDGKRRKTQGMGKRKDSNVPPSTAPADLPPPRVTNPTFVTFVLSDLVVALTGTAFYFNLQQVVQDNDMEGAKDVIYPCMALIGIVARVLSGRMIDRLNHKIVFLTALLSSAMSLLLIPSMTTYTAFVALPVSAAVSSKPSK